jgi:hypothetical protein
MVHISGKRERIRGTLWASIHARRIIEFCYHGGYRTVEPFALGMVRYGNPNNESLLCYQIGGCSDLSEVVGWKLYRASEMKDISVSYEQFSGDRRGYDPDKIDMVKIYCRVTPVKKSEAAVKVITKGEPKAEATPLLHDEPPPEPVVKNLTHNELMRRFRLTHPIPIPEIYTNILSTPPAKPPSESVELKSVPSMKKQEQRLPARVKP